MMKAQHLELSWLSKYSVSNIGKHSRWYVGGKSLIIARVKYCTNKRLLYKWTVKFMYNHNDYKCQIKREIDWEYEY